MPDTNEDKEPEVIIVKLGNKQLQVFHYSQTLYESISSLIENLNESVVMAEGIYPEVVIN